MNQENNISRLYLQKLGFFDATLEPSLENLNRLLVSHVQNIPFGNFDPYLGLSVELDIATLSEKF